MRESESKGINILIFWFASDDTWNEGRTFQNIAEQLAKLHDIRRVIVAFPPTRRHGLPLNTRRISKKLFLVTETTAPLPENGHLFRLRNWINRLTRIHALHTYLKLSGLKKENTILWVFPPHPHIDTLVASIPHTLLVSHIVDNFTKHNDPWLSRHALIQYPKLSTIADVLISGSKFNLDYFNHRQSANYLFENAVDPIFLGTPTATPVSRDGTTRIGYVGTLSERTDLELLKHVACTRPNWHLFIAGKNEFPQHTRDWFDLPNVTYLGILPYRELPEFLRNLDVCLIPHLNTDYCKSMSPLKLFQYLATGRPIVSTDIEGLDRVKDHIRIAQSHDDFVKQIEHALQHDTKDESKRRIERARLETWESRVSEIFQVIKLHLQQKKLM